jgi:hypothetical protein
MCLLIPEIADGGNPWAKMMQFDVLHAHRTVKMIFFDVAF